MDRSGQNSGQSTGRPDPPEMAQVLEQLARVRRRHQEILELLRDWQDCRVGDPAVTTRQLQVLSQRAKRQLEILEHLDQLLAHMNPLKPLVLGPARLAGWLGRLSGDTARRLGWSQRGAPAGRTACVLMVAVNGIGLGHLTRTLAVARRLRRIDRRTQVVLLTTSPAVHLAFGQAVTAYYVPSVQALPREHQEEFGGMLQRQLAALVRRHQPGAIVYDGIWPSRGLLKAMGRTRAARRYWLRRGRWKRPPHHKQLRAEDHFDLIIEPGEVGLADGAAAGKQRRVDPITYLDPGDLLERTAARYHLGLPLDHQVVLVSLGAANPAINRDLAMVQAVLQDRPRTTVVIAESIIGSPLKGESLRARFLREYPVSRYFNAFDAAVTAAGYNTVHESVTLGLPCVFIPNLNRDTDDQAARARAVEQAGAGICLAGPDNRSLGRALERVLEQETNQAMRRACRELATPNGADQVARIILGAEELPNP